MTYSPPAGNITSLNQVLVWSNGLVNNLLFPAILGAVFFITFVRLLFTTNETGKAFAAASFICMILSVLLRVTNLINNSFMIIFIILTAIGAIWMHTENSKYA